MIKINLLPDDIGKEESKNDLAIILIGAGVVAAILLASIYVYMFFVEKKVTSNLSSAKQILNNYRSIAAEVEKLQSDKALLETRKNVIENLIKSRLLYSIFMYDLVSILPDKIWLQNITTKTNDDNSLSIDIAAKTFSTTFIADWIVSLESFPAFTFSELGAITTTKQAEGAKIFSFTMKIKYRKQQ